MKVNTFDSRDFVSMWMIEGTTITDISEYFGISRKSVTSHASYLRKKGVPLPLKHSLARRPKTFTPELIAELVSICKDKELLDMLAERRRLDPEAPLVMSSDGQEFP